MARWYSEHAEFTEISQEDKLKRDRIIAIIAEYTREMEGYSYFGSNTGVAQEDYEDVADDIMKAFGI